MASLRRRKKTYYLRYYVDGKQRERCLETDSYQIARELMRRYESAQAQGVEQPLPTRSSLSEVLQAYTEHLRATKTPKSCQTEIYYLREAFGVACDGLAITSRKPGAHAEARARNKRVDRRRKTPRIEAASLEQVSTEQIGAYIDFKVREHGISPKTANHYRSIIRRLFNWAVETKSIRLPGGINPASRVKPYKETASQIRFLTLPQIDEQLHALRFNPRLQAVVAVFIYAGLRREELTWLTQDDVVMPRGQRGGVIRVGAKTIDGQSWQPKTRKNRAIPMSRTLVACLQQYPWPPTQSPATDDHFRGWFAPSPLGRRYDPDNLSRELREANLRAGLRWTALDFRHTFGSHLAQRGVSLYKISALMGNSPEIVRRHYAQLVPEAMADEVEFTQSPGIVRSVS